MNWLDWLILIALLLGAVNGFRAGFVRLVIGFGALIVAFFAASWLHGLTTGYLHEYITNRLAASLLAYALVFFGVIACGSLIASLIVRIFRLIGLSPLDRVLGGLLGLVRATVGLAVLVMVLMAFTPNRLPAAVHRSTLAPWVVGASRILSAATPYDIRHGVETTYSQLRDRLRAIGAKRLPVREE